MSNKIPADCKALLEAYQHRWQQNNNSIVFFPLSEAYRKIGQTDRAIELCEFGLAKHPYYHGARVTLAKAYIEKNRIEEAKTELEKVLEAAPNNLAAGKLLAQIYDIEGNISKAVNRYRTINAYYPEIGEFKKRVAYLLEVELPKKKKLLHILEKWRQAFSRKSLALGNTL